MREERGDYHLDPDYWQRNGQIQVKKTSLRAQTNYRNIQVGIRKRMMRVGVEDKSPVR